MSRPKTWQKCFVISSYGRVDSPEAAEREAWNTANAVKEKIIDVALQRLVETGEAAITAYRGDADTTTGEITKAIFQSICRDHILIAVLFRISENVSYEVGLAHAMGRPVILLRHSGYKQPFDFQGVRHIEFTDDALAEPSASRESVIKALTGVVRSLLTPSGAPAFASNFLHTKAVPFARCVPYDRFSAIEWSDWSKLFHEAEDQIWIAGQTLFGLFQPRWAQFTLPTRENGENSHALVTLSTLLELVVASGRHVNVLVLDSRNPGIDFKLLQLNQQDDKGRKERHSELKKKLVSTTRVVRDLAGTMSKQLKERPGGTFCFTRIRHGLLTHRVTMSERRGFVTPIFQSVAVNSGPAFEVYPKSKVERMGRDEDDGRFGEISLYSAVRDELAMLQRHNPCLRVSSDGEITDELDLPAARRTPGSR